MSGIESVAPEVLARRLQAGEDIVLLDVREAEELALCQLSDIQHIPLGELALRFEELDRSRALVCICHHGIRSMVAARFLAQNGFESLLNLTGGMDRWASEVDREMTRY